MMKITFFNPVRCRTLLVAIGMNTTLVWWMLLLQAGLFLFSLLAGSLVNGGVVPVGIQVNGNETCGGMG